MTEVKAVVARIGMPGFRVVVPRVTVLPEGRVHIVVLRVASLPVLRVASPPVVDVASPLILRRVASLPVLGITGLLEIITDVVAARVIAARVAAAPVPRILVAARRIAGLLVLGPRIVRAA